MKSVKPTYPGQSVIQTFYYIVKAYGCKIGGKIKVETNEETETELTIPFPVAGIKKKRI